MAGQFALLGSMRRRLWIDSQKSICGHTRGIEWVFVCEEMVN
jgi:hypothetical protein